METQQRRRNRILLFLAVLLIVSLSAGTGIFLLNTLGIIHVLPQPETTTPKALGTPHALTPQGLEYGSCPNGITYTVVDLGKGTDTTDTRQGVYDLWIVTLNGSVQFDTSQKIVLNPSRNVSEVVNIVPASYVKPQSVQFYIEGDLIGQDLYLQAQVKNEGGGPCTINHLIQQHT